MNFFNRYPWMPSLPFRWRFPIWYFFECCSQWIDSHILLRNCFASFSSCCWYVFVHFPYLLVEFSFIVLECPVLSVLFDSTSVSYCLTSFANTFRFISSNCIACFICSVAFLFSSQYILDFFLCLSIFACCRFRICVYSLISKPGIDFLVVFFRGTPILSQTNFAPALISSFNSVMLFVEIYIDKLFIFSVSTVTVF